MEDKTLNSNLPLNETKTTDKESSLQYKVLARKYRPNTFEDLIGQDSTVKILSNAFSLNRIAHAFLFTGVRGVGKTTAARIVAKGLNCLKSDSPTISPCSECSSCVSAKNDRHVDIVEIDAASHTGVDDVRELTEGARYKPAEGRYKIYIIDEVHMLSNQAFNALLKTLEEPPEHVKFIFCTTEIRKIPVTVLSRCQKFDLRRVSISEIIKLLKNISNKENVKINVNALNLLGRYSDGSVRDALSLLDQAISIGKNEITEKNVKEMLGLSDKSKIWDLFDDLMSGKILSVIKLYEDLLSSGSDPILIIEELMEISHIVARTKAAPSLDTSQIMSEFESNRALKSTENMTIPSVTRCWQLLLKGYSEMQKAFSVKEAGEMILIRIAYAVDLPDLKSLLDKSGLKKKKVETKNLVSKDKKYINNENGNINNLFDKFDDLLNYLQAKKSLSIYTILVDQVKIVEYKPYNIKMSLIDNSNIDIINKIKKELFDITSKHWVIKLLEDKNEYTSVSEKDKIYNQKLINEAKKNKLVDSFFKEFPDAEIVKVSKEKGDINKDN